jgi:L-alanine-DL-glutamate epimerase-like enolase superfamily enzyme
MKISGVESFVVGNPPPSLGGRYFTFVKLTTDDGIVGYGEAYAATFHPDVVSSMLLDVAERHLIGYDPFDIETFWRRAYGRGFTLRPDVSLQGVMSALEMACWDIMGKAVGEPVYRLLGGQVHERLRTYTYIYPKAGDATNVYVDPDLAVTRAIEYADQGFTALKFDPAGPYTVMGGHQPSQRRMDLSVEFARKLRDALGTGVDLLIGTHGQFTAPGAVRLASRLEPFDPLWFEEPVPPDDFEGLALVSARTTIPVATGERLTTTTEFARALGAGVRILQPNLGRAGGILEGKKIAALAQTHNAQIAPHLYCGPIVGAANVQVATCSPNFLILEGILDWGGIHADLLNTPLQWEEGWLIPPTAPGLGVELDEEVARAHPYDGDGLHLDMTEDSFGPED